jgi:hypothetical protein
MVDRRASFWRVNALSPVACGASGFPVAPPVTVRPLFPRSCSFCSSLVRCQRADCTDCALVSRIKGSPERHAKDTKRNWFGAMDKSISRHRDAETAAWRSFQTVFLLPAGNGDCTRPEPVQPGLRISEVESSELGRDVSWRSGAGAVRCS